MTIETEENTINRAVDQFGILFRSAMLHRSAKTTESKLRYQRHIVSAEYAIRQCARQTQDPGVQWAAGEASEIVALVSKN